MSSQWTLLGASAIAALLILAAAARRFLRAPLYRPGMVKSGTNPATSLEPPRQSGDPSSWTVEDGVRLFHQAKGSGPRVLVIHGGPGIPIRAPWDALAPLEASFTFELYDQRGCGRSTRPVAKMEPGFSGMKKLERSLGLGVQVADIERIRRILGEEQLTIVGHSFGAFLASLYAAEFPERVRALALVAPAAALKLPAEGGGLFGTVRTLLPESRRPDFDRYLARLFDFRHLASRTDAELSQLNTELIPFYREALQAHGLPGPQGTGTPPPGWVGGFMVHAMYLSMGREHDYRPALTKVTAPALVLHGGRDLQSEAESMSYAEAIPNARFRVIAQAGHFIFDDAPEEFAAAVGELLRSAGDAASR